MNADVYSNEFLIGTTNLKVGDGGMGVLIGELNTNQNYFDKVQKKVWKFWETNNPNYEEWYSLKLNVQLENGYFIYAEGGFTIDDIEDLKDEPKSIEIAGVDNNIILDYFQHEPPRQFIKEPWEKITINQKLRYENELRIELGVESQIPTLERTRVFSFFKKKIKTHKLLNFECSALCKYQCNDDILFTVRKKGIEKHFAVVHLTHKGKVELPNFPTTQLFTDFEEFRKLRMEPDIEEWID